MGITNTLQSALISIRQNADYFSTEHDLCLAGKVALNAIGIERVDGYIYMACTQPATEWRARIAGMDADWDDEIGAGIPRSKKYFND